jgi:hypothetical protein
LVVRQRTVEATVGDAVGAAWRHTPWAGPPAWGPRGHARLARHALSVAPSAAAWAQTAWVPGLRVRRRQWASGHVQDREAWRVPARRERMAMPAPPPAGGSVPTGDRGRRRAAPTALAALVPPELPLAQVPGSRGWRPGLLTRWYGQGLRSVLGRWGGVPQTTI